MNRIERLIVGIIVLLVLAGVYGVLAFRATRSKTPQEDTAPQASPQTQVLPAEIKAELLQSAFIDRLRTLEVNGNLPVEVTEGETYKGQERNPFDQQ